MRTFLYRYEHEGTQYCISVIADSEEQANNQLAHLTYDGELLETIQDDSESELIQELQNQLKVMSFELAQLKMTEAFYMVDMEDWEELIEYQPEEEKPVRFEVIDGGKKDKFH